MGARATGAWYWRGWNGSSVERPGPGRARLAAAGGSSPNPVAGSVILRGAGERRIRGGHLWVYAGEIERVAGAVAPGGIVDVTDGRGRFLGRGYYNPASTIAVRLLTRERAEEVDEGLLRRRIAAAVARRRRIYAPGESCRLVFGEGDWLPGLVVDGFGDCLVLQLGTLGMERWRDAIVSILCETLAPRGIYERSDVPTRVHEGLEPRSGVLYGEVPEPIEIALDGLRFLTSLRGGQKTGMYLDHRLNRRALAPHSPGRQVLDVFCNSGSFALYALQAGAAAATGIEISPECLELARCNARLNGLVERCRWIEGNAFDQLRELDRAGQRFGLIVLDPPAFTKSSRATAAARRGYKEINLRALRLAEAGGIVFTATCSYHMSAEEFLDVLRDAAADAGRAVTLVELRGQAPDHPVNLCVPETRYLKCAVLQVH